MSKYFDRQGNPITMLEWAHLFEDPEYKRIDETTLPDGTWISTVFLGLNHQWGDGPPIIFESMVFPSKEELSELDCIRYTTEADAREGHQELVQEWQAKIKTT